ncbi:NAD(P)/FAD-dependent oxidoreductase [Tateyamaria sp.]|uniref:NAD(P)/FAD-dependent oxidoreductase n=1 Tax=Tateyamaria sp. TaxID=1929288 RepID=UPI003B2183CA
MPAFGMGRQPKVVNDLLRVHGRSLGWAETEGKHMKVVIIGAGIIGAALARSLSTSGADVTVMSSGVGATAASFGWINASFYLDADHFRLRAAGLEAWRRLDVPLNWSGALCWEEEGAGFDQQFKSLSDLNYDVDVIDQEGFSELEPHVVAPARALRFAIEGVAEPRATAQNLLAGVRRIIGVPVRRIATTAGRVSGVETDQGVMPADRVIVAAGNGSPALLEPLGVALPMLDRPGLMMRTGAVPPMLAHVLVTPEGEVRQDSGGHIWMPTAAAHQSDASTQIDSRPDVLADQALARLEALVPGTALAWDRVMLAYRPVPQDGRPVIGPCGPEGLFTAVMHSGVTLAAITAELLAPQVLDRPLSNAQADLIAPYGPSRF